MTDVLIKNLLKPENGLEEAIVADKDFIAGAVYGKPRAGHPEGRVVYHIGEVLANIDRFYPNDDQRSELRIIALLHDTFKNKVNQNLPKSGENHHGMIARRFAEKFPISEEVLEIIELHDEAYNAYCKGGRDGNWYKAKERLGKLTSRLLKFDSLELYTKFYHCDNSTGDKSQENYEWFLEQTYNL